MSALAEAETFTGELGCGVYGAYLVTRGGRDLICELPWTSLSWERVVDDTSQASVQGVYPSGDLRPCDLPLAAARAWKHEVAIFRNGTLVWVGPLLKPTFGVDSFQFDARDLSAWWDHRLVHNDHVFDTPTDAATVFEAVVDDAMSPDNTPGVFVAPTMTGTMITLTVLQSQYVMAGRTIRDLADSAIDWTMFQRNVMVGGAEVPVAPLGLLIDDHFQVMPSPNLDGSQQANAWTITGSGGGSDGATVVGAATDLAEYAEDGLLEAVDQIDTLTDNDGATAAAQSRLALTKEVFLIEDAVLAPSAPVDINALVAGVVVPLDLRLTVPQIQGRYRMQKLTVNANADGSETVALTLQPEGSTA